MEGFFDKNGLFNFDDIISIPEVQEKSISFTSQDLATKATTGQTITTAPTTVILVGEDQEMYDTNQSKV